MKEKQLVTALQIGAAESSIVAAKKAITEILDYEKPPEVLVAALTTLGTISRVSNVNITGNHFTVKND